MFSAHFPGNRRSVLVAVDYFAKWEEAEVLANIRDVDMKKFVWKKHSNEIWGVELVDIR